MNEIDYMIVGKRIRKLRLEHQMSQKQLCEAVGITQGHLSKAENGQVISSEVAEKLAEVLEVTVDELLNGTKESKANRKRREKYEKEASKGRSAEEKKRLHEFATRMSGFDDNSVGGIDLERASALMEASQEGLDLLKACNNTFTVTADEAGNFPFHDKYDENGELIEKTEAPMEDPITYVFKLKLEFRYRYYYWTAEEVKRLDGEGNEIVDEEFQPVPWNADPNKDLRRDTVERVPYVFEMETQFNDSLRDDKEPWTDQQVLIAGLVNDEYYRGTDNLPTSYKKAVENGMIIDYPRRTEDGRVDWKGEFERFKKKITVGVTRKSLNETDENNSTPCDIYYRGHSYGLNERGKIKIISAPYYDDEYKYQIDDKIITETQLKAQMGLCDDDIFEFKRVLD